jgi:hypothetical protein
MSFIIYPQESGQIAVVMPVDPSLTIEQVIQKDVPSDVPYLVVDNLDMVDNEYFNAHDFHPLSGAVVNTDRAKELLLNKWREARVPLLQKLDVAYMKALETGDPTTIASVVSAKQVLRDVTKTPLPDDLLTLKTVWPECLKTD